ncbi:tonB-system energizer ExbB [Gemmobacter lanyuensis]|uniref:tonB-system energizer ExbB n=1 Tax=Gemmobacter lanyuensis TaxID=1054497 RepID=UPI00167AC2DF|nr:tonB-system energizer ExbB [Gemmobacter lanyuensis]
MRTPFLLVLAAVMICGSALAQPAPPAPAQTPAITAPVAPAPPDPVVQAAPLPEAHDLSPLGMYRKADWVVKSVMITLLVASFLTWTVWLFKTVELALARWRVRRAGRALRGAETLAAAAQGLPRRADPATFMARAVLEEYSRSDAALPQAGAEGVKERAASLVARIEGQALARLRRGTGILATVGAVAPFVGLFGTVWGIMNAFIGIAETKTTNLAVVAPGIAEALFATAIGLVAAIPAVVIYNHFTRAIGGYRMHLQDAGAAVLRLLSRDIDFRKLRGA